MKPSKTPLGGARTTGALCKEVSPSIDKVVSILQPSSGDSSSSSAESSTQKSSDGNISASRAGLASSSRGTLGPIRVDDSHFIFELERSGSKLAAKRPALSAPLPASHEPGVADPQVRSFCQWLEQSCLSPEAVTPLTSEALSAARFESPLTATGSAMTSNDFPVDAPFRRYDCSHYETCLEIAAALDWENFTCNGCCGELDQRLLWRAKNAVKRDDVAKRCCQFSECSVGELPPDRNPLNITKTTSEQVNQSSQPGGPLSKNRG